MEIRQDVQPQKQGFQTWLKIMIIVFNWSGWWGTIEWPQVFCATGCCSSTIGYLVNKRNLRA